MRKQVSCLEKDNARNNARCTQARKTTHCLNGQQQDVTASRILLSAFRVSAFLPTAVGGSAQGSKWTRIHRAKINIQTCTFAPAIKLNVAKQLS